MNFSMRQLKAWFTGKPIERVRYRMQPLRRPCDRCQRFVAHTKAGRAYVHRCLPDITDTMPAAKE